ncbi:MAG: hypothetical protein ABI867_20980 [Kofleriaceae bacterium]
MRESRVAFKPVIVRDEPREAIYEPSTTPHLALAPPEVSVATTASLLAILAATHPGETIAMAYQRKEHALASTIAALPVTEALALHRKLTQPSETSELVIQFNRLTIDRRGRLLAFIADARRREATKRRS